MKKLIALLLALLMIFSLAACDLGTNDDDDDCKHKDKDGDGYCDKCDEEMEEDEEENDDGENGTPGDGESFVLKLLSELAGAKCARIKLALNDVSSSVYYSVSDPDTGEEFSDAKQFKADTERVTEIDITASIGKEGGYNLKIEYSVKAARNGAGVNYTDEESRTIFVIDGISYEYYRDTNTYKISSSFNGSTLESMISSVMGNPLLTDKELVSALDGLILYLGKGIDAEAGSGSYEVDLSALMNDIITIAAGIDGDARVCDVIDRALYTLGEKITTEDILKRLEELSGMTARAAIKELNSELDKSTGTDLDRIVSAALGDQKIRNMIANALASELGGDTYDRIMSYKGNSLSELLGIFTDTDRTVWELLSESAFGSDAPSSEEFFARIRHRLSLSVSDFEEQTDNKFFTNFSNAYSSLEVSKMGICADYKNNSKGKLERVDGEFSFIYTDRRDSGYEDKLNEYSYDISATAEIELYSDKAMSIALPSGATESVSFEGEYAVLSAEGAEIGYLVLAEDEKGSILSVNGYVDISFSSYTADSSGRITVRGNDIDHILVRGADYDFDRKKYDMTITFSKQDRGVTVSYAVLDEILSGSSEVNIARSYTMLGGEGEVLGYINLKPQGDVYIEINGVARVRANAYFPEGDGTTVRIFGYDVTEIFCYRTEEYLNPDGNSDIIVTCDTAGCTATLSYAVLDDLSFIGTYTLTDSDGGAIGYLTAYAGGITVDIEGGVRISTDRYVIDHEGSVLFVPGEQIREVYSYTTDRYVSYSYDEDMTVTVDRAAGTARIDYLYTDRLSELGGYELLGSDGGYVGYITIDLDGVLVKLEGIAEALGYEYDVNEEAREIIVYGEGMSYVYSVATLENVYFDRSHDMIIEYDRDTSSATVSYVVFDELSALRSFDLKNALGEKIGYVSVWRDSIYIQFNGYAEIDISDYTIDTTAGMIYVSGEDITRYYSLVNGHVTFDTGAMMKISYDIATGTAEVSHTELNKLLLFGNYTVINAVGDSAGFIDFYDTSLYVYVEGVGGITANDIRIDKDQAAIFASGEGMNDLYVPGVGYSELDSTYDMTVRYDVINRTATVEYYIFEEILSN